MPRVTHFEIHAQNPERAINFYQHCFNWQFQAFNPDDYWLISTGPEEEPGIDGGLIRRRGEIDGNAVIAYVCTIDVEDIDHTSKTIAAQGGTPATEKMPIPGVGWLAHFKDTEGNIFGVMELDANAA